MRYEIERETAVEAVIEASRLCQAVRLEMIEPFAMMKTDKSPVTVADFGSQALICRAIASRFPADQIVAEESSADLINGENDALMDQITQFVHRSHSATAEEICSWIDLGGGEGRDRFWTLDPLDGTRGFLRGDQYAIALALIVDGEVVVGALACPDLPHDLDHPDDERGVVFWAVHNEGWSASHIEGRSPLPMTRSNGPVARVIQSQEAATSDHDLQEIISARMQFADPPLKMDSQAKYAAVARGDASLYLRLRSPSSPNYLENIWDHAAGALLVTESGGRVTDSLGHPLDFTRGHKLTQNVGIVASKGLDHDMVISVIDSTE